MDADLRKKKTEAFLRGFNIPVNISLPLIEDESDCKIRSAKDVAERVLILTYLNCVTDDELERNSIIQFLKNDGLWNAVSNEEKKLFEKEILTKKRKNTHFMEK